MDNPPICDVPTGLERSGAVKNIMTLRDAIITKVHGIAGEYAIFV
jgi:hypothetical protein